jgi:polar amino acid transport system substrate-binding protein
MSRLGFPVRVFVVLAVSFVAGLALAACGESSGGSASTGSGGSGGGGGGGKEYVVATSADFPPLSFRSPDNPNQVVGFEPDMVKALMDHLGWRYKTITSDFNGLIPAVQSGRVDMVVSDVYNTAERRQVVDFVNYLSNNFSVMVKAENAAQVTSFLDICGKTLGILTGSAPELEAARAGSRQCTEAGKPPIKIRSYPAVAQELPPLDNGTLFAILETNVSLGYIESQHKGKYKLVFDAPGDKTKVGIVIQKGSPFKDRLEEAMEWYIRTPAYAENAKKWGLPKSSLLASGA